MQVVRQNYGIADDLRRTHWATHRLCLKQFFKLGSAVEEDSQHELELDWS